MRRYPPLLQRIAEPDEDHVRVELVDLGHEIIHLVLRHVAVAVGDVQPGCIGSQTLCRGGRHAWIAPEKEDSLAFHRATHGKRTCEIRGRHSLSTQAPSRRAAQTID